MGASVRVNREPPSATERVARLRLYFREVPLTELVEDEVLAVDRDEHEVREGRRFEEKWEEIEWVHSGINTY